MKNDMSLQNFGEGVQKRSLEQSPQIWVQKRTYLWFWSWNFKLKKLSHHTTLGRTVVCIFPIESLFSETAVCSKNGLFTKFMSWMVRLSFLSSSPAKYFEFSEFEFEFESASLVLCTIFIIRWFSWDFKIQNSLKWSIWRVFIFSRKKVPCNEQGCLYPLYFRKTFAWGFKNLALLWP